MHGQLRPAPPAPDQDTAEPRREDCGDDFTCDAEDGCVYRWRHRVDRPAAARTLAARSVASSFHACRHDARSVDTPPPRTCALQGFTSWRRSRRLFAVDVPAAIVIEISLRCRLRTPSPATPAFCLMAAGHAETMCNAYNADASSTPILPIKPCLCTWCSTPARRQGANMGIGQHRMFVLEVTLRRSAAVTDSLWRGIRARPNVFDDDGCSPLGGWKRLRVHRA